MKKNITLKKYANRIAKRLMKRGYTGVDAGTVKDGIVTIRFVPRYAPVAQDTTAYLRIKTNSQCIFVGFVDRPTHLVGWELYRPKVIVRLVDMLLFNPTPYMP